MSKVILKNVRCSYVFVREQRKNKDGDDKGAKYSIQVIIPKSDTTQLKLVRDAIREVAKAKFPKVTKLSMLKTPLRDGDEERDQAEYEGTVFFNANNYQRKPGILNRQKEKATESDLDKYCYSGAYFNVSVSFYSFSRDDGKGVAVGMNNIMLWREGEHLDGQIDPESDFEDLEAGDDLGDDSFDDLDEL